MSIWNLSGFNIGPSGEHVKGSALTQAEQDYGKDVDKVAGTVRPIAKRPYIGLDIETLGTHELAPITEIGLSHSERGDIAWKVHPGYKVNEPLLTPGQYAKEEPVGHPYCDRDAVWLTGYNDKEWEGAPTFAEIAPALWEWLSTDHPILVGWNISAFDWPRLEWRFKSLGFNAGRIGRVIVDCMGLAAAVIPSRISDLKLDTTCAYFGFKSEGVHRALGGAQRAKWIFEKFREGGERVFR